MLLQTHSIVSLFALKLIIFDEVQDFSAEDVTKNRTEDELLT